MGVLCSPDAAQRAVLHGVVRCRAGVVTHAGVWNGPGSAERHEECRTASGTRESGAYAASTSTSSESSSAVIFSFASSRIATPSRALTNTPLTSTLPTAGTRYRLRVL